MAEQVSGTSYPPPGRPRHTVGLVPGPVPPEYKGTENLKAEQRAAREPLKSTDPIMQPAVEPGSVQNVNVAPDISAPVAEETGVSKTNLGGLPKWSSVLTDTDYRAMGRPEQNKVKERWLRTIADLNPQYSADDMKELRKAIYQSQAEPLPLTEQVYRGAKKVKGTLEPPPPVKSMAEVMFETAVPSVTKTKLPPSVEQAPTEKGALQKIFETYEAEGAPGVAKKAGWYALEETMKKLEQIQFTSSWFFGGLEGKLAKEREIARKEGRMKYLRELPDAERYKIYENIMFSDGYTGVDERIADVIRNDFLPAGMTVQDIDRAVIKGIQEKKFPEQAFYNYGPPTRKVHRPGAPPPSEPFEAIGYAVSHGLDLQAANQAMWENLHQDMRVIKDASTLRKQMKGKTFEEKYGFWKGLAMNVLLTTAGDPVTWGTLGLATVPIAAKTAATRLGQKVSYALAGRTSLRETLEAAVELVSKGGKEAEGLRPWINLIVREAKKDLDYAGKDKAAAMEAIDKLVQQAPITDKAKAGAQKISETVRETGGPINITWWDGVVPQTAEEAALPTAAKEAGKYSDLGGKMASEKKAMEAAAAAEKAAKEAAELAAKREAVAATGRVVEGGAPAVERGAARTVETVPAAVSEPINPISNIKLPEIGSDGISKADEAVDAALDAVNTRRMGISSTAPENAVEDLRKARAMGDLAEEERLLKLRTHDIDSRRKLIKIMQDYEQMLGDKFSTPTQREKALQHLQREWTKLHPDDAGGVELERVMKERAANRAGEIVDDPTGSDLIPVMGDDWTSQWKIKKPMTPEEAYEKTTAEARKADRELYERALKEFEAGGGKVQKIAARAEQEPRIVGEQQWNSAREQALLDEGLELFSGEEQTGHIAQRLGGEWDEYKDSLKYAVESGKQAVQNLNIKGMKEAARIGWAGFTEAKGKMFEKFAADQLLSGKDKQQLKRFFDRAEAAVRAEMKRPGRKGLDPIERELKKAEKFYANTLKRNAARKSPIIAKKMTDGSIKVSRIQHGRKVDSYFTPPEHNDGEFIGSIFGMAQKFWDARAARRAGASARHGLLAETEKLKKSAFSIEKQFENFPLVGKAVKTMYSTMDAIQERAIDDMTAIAKRGKTGRFALRPGGKRYKLTNEDMQNIPLYHENTDLFKALPAEEQARLAPVMEQVKKFYDDFQKMYKDRGADVDFKAHYQQGLVNSNKKIDELIAGLQSGTIKYVSKKDFASVGVYNLPEGFNGYSKAKVARLLEQAKVQNTDMLKEIDSFQYINIPYAMWFDSTFDRAAALKSLKLANAHKRTTFRIADLIASNAINKEQINLFDMMAAYSRRAAKDIAMLDIRNAMAKEGVFKSFDDLKKLAPALKKKEIQKLKAEGWRRMDPRHFPFYSRGWMHPAMQEWLYTFKYDRLNANTFDKVLSSVKVWQFANPFFLPYYDIMQGAVARGPIGMLNPVGWGRDMIAAVKMYKNKSPIYWELLHEGLESKPMSMPFDEWAGKIMRLKGETGTEFLVKYAKDTAKSGGLKPIYETSWFAAWEMDKLVRLATCNYLLRKGFSVADAAKASALLHSDYANVPVATRRALNRVLFTGTFKVTMFRLYKDMMKNMLKVPYYMATGRGKELTKTERLLSKAGYTTIFAGMAGFDMFMTAKGYERDQFARRYFKPVMTNEGPKEDVVVFSSPLTMVPKYWYSFSKFMNENYKDDRIGELVNEFKYDIHPVYRIGLDIVNNKKANGEKIWEPFADSGAMKWAKNAEYTAQQVWQIFKQIGMEKIPEDQQKAWELFREEWGPLAAYIMKPTSFQYLRDPAVKRYVKDLQKMQRAFQFQIRDMAEDNKYDPRKVNRMAQELQKRSKRIVDLIQQAERVNDRNAMERWQGGVAK